MGDQFKECPTCAAKPGSPPLCPLCLHNRGIINDLEQEVWRLEKLIDEERSMAEEEKTREENSREQHERWECRVCGTPCRVDIIFSDSKLPDHLKGNERFRSKRCLCKETIPDWRKT